MSAELAKSGPTAVKCGCCEKLVSARSAARGWCITCEMEFARVLVYIEAAAKIVRYAAAKAR